MGVWEDSETLRIQSRLRHGLVRRPALRPKVDVIPRKHAYGRTGGLWKRGAFWKSDCGAFWAQPWISGRKGG